MSNTLKGFRFIDLFAGIGGFHLALSSFDAECVFASEIDKYASETYLQNFGINPYNDITQTKEKDIPEHEILCAGFPCQAFSVSGKQKGFADTRGTLFFDIARIIKYHKPYILFLENVKNFEKHNNGNTLKTVTNILEELNYKVFYNVLNAGNFGLPQNRERIYFVCFRKDLNIKNFEFPSQLNINTCLFDFLEEEPEAAKLIKRNDVVINKDFELELNLFGEYILPNKPVQIGIVNKGGQGERIYSPYGHAITLSAYGGGIGSKTGIYKINGHLRKLSPRECARIQGFPDSYVINNSVSQSYKQFGNSVAINVLKEITKEICKVINKMDKKQIIGSYTAKGGFKNEDDICKKFINYKTDLEAQKWLKIMGYEFEKIQELNALQIPPKISKSKALSFGVNEEKINETIKFKKADIQVKIEIKIDNIYYIENISLKKANIGAGYNQIDKRAVKTYQKMWGFNDSIAESLKLFTGELTPNIPLKNLKDKRRMFLDEMEESKANEIVDYFEKNKVLVFSDLIKGRGALSADWFLVTRKDNKNGKVDWILKDINFVCNFFSQGNIFINKNGNLKLGKITLQRKGGTPDPTSMQFKLNPLDLFG